MEDNMRIKKVSASEQVCEAIQEQISGGVWRVGDKLPSESELAQKFGVNRLTVRMALQKLNALGIVETRTGSGTFVIEFDFEGYLKTASRFFEQSGMMQNVTEFRNHIEIECARLAMERATPEDLVAEFVREKLFLHLRQELPHSVGVLCDEIDYADDGHASIEATILVERDGQKGIVLGRGGQMIKRVGIEARRDIERLLGCKVYLNLTVRVAPQWRRDEREIRRLGYGLEE